MPGADAEIDPNVELLADIPIAGPEEDLMDLGRLAQRLVELAVAAPVTAPRGATTPYAAPRTYRRRRAR